MEFGSCDTCGAPFQKATAKFCSKCGSKRHVAKAPVGTGGGGGGAPLAPVAGAPPAPSARSTLPPTSPPTSSSVALAQPATIPAVAVTTTAAAPAAAAGPSSAVAPPTPPQAPPRSEGSSAALKPRRASTDVREATANNNTASFSGDSRLDSDFINTLDMDDADDTTKYNEAMATLGPNGITPDMLQTTNAEELKQYKKGSLLGRGTYGSVYLGLLPDGSFHAVKTVELGGKTGNIQPKELVSLSREINMMRRLVHRNLCTFKGVFYSPDEGSVNMFMEYVGGGSLTSIVKRFKPLPPAVVRMWTKQLLSGLLYLHTQRIIHRDIKGENILIDTSSDPSKHAQVKLVDFGAAKRLTDAVAQSRTVIGTPYWMAPEVVDLTGEGNGYSYKADVWSVGCTVAEMITGKPPWPAKSNIPAAILMIAQCQGLPTDMPTVEQGATAGSVDFMTKCFVRNPEERPTVEDLLEHPWIKGDME